MEYSSPDTLHSAPGYSHVVSIPAGRRLVITAGQVGINPDGSVPDGLEAQARVAFDNLGRALQAAGAEWTDVVKLTYFAIDAASAPTLRAVRDEHIDTTQPPASTLVQVAALVRPELLVEIEAIAAPATD